MDLERKKKNIIDYITGSTAYYHFISYFHGAPNADSTLIYEPGILRYAKAANVVNLYTSLKEKLIEKQDGGYKSVLFLEDLESIFTKSLIKKEDDLYYLGTHCEKSVPDMIAFIRNCFAHGSYEVDTSDNTFILYDSDNKEIKVDINDLGESFITAIGLKIIYSNTKVQSRKIVSSESLFEIIKTPLTNINDIEKALGMLQIKDYVLSSKDDSYIDKFSLFKFNTYCNLVNNTFLNTEIICPKTSSLQEENEIKKIIDKIRHDLRSKTSTKRKEKMFNAAFDGSNYEMKIKRSGIKPCEIKRIASVFDREVGFYDCSLQEQIFKIRSQIYLHLDNDSSKLMIDNARMITFKLIDFLEKGNSMDDFFNSNRFSTFEKVQSQFPEYLVSILIDAISSMYAYSHDDIYGLTKSNRSFENSDMLLQSLSNPIDNLDLSFIKPEICNCDYTYLEEVEQFVSKAMDDFSRANSGLAKSYKNYKIAIDTNPDRDLSRFKSKLLKEEKELSDVIEKVVVNTLNRDEVREYYEEHDNLRNRAIITGIRNSIAHGNYSYDPMSAINVDDTVVNFEDKHEGKITFKASIKISDLEKLTFEENAVKMYESLGFVVTKYIK